jgi:integrase
MVNEEDKLLLEKWFLIRNIESSTQKTYMLPVKEYTSLLGKTLIELLKEAKDENLSTIEITDRMVTLNLLRFKKHLKDSGKAPSTVNLYYAAIISFYRAFNIILPEIILDKGDIGLEKNIGKRMEREDIQKLIGVAPPRERALIYLMALSGMGQQEARDLKIKTILDAASSATGHDLKDVYDLFTHEKDVLEEVLTLSITRKKVKYRHHTFLPPEATREIISYLKERCYGRNKNIRITNINDTVFVNKKGSELSRDSIVTNFRRIGLETGFKKEKGCYSYWRSHSLRKYFITTVINKGGNKTFADYMAGHVINSQDRTYWKPSVDDLKKVYLKVLPHLSIDHAKVRDVDSKELKEMREDSKKKDERIKMLEEKQAKYEKREEFFDKLFNNEEFIERYLKT